MVISVILKQRKCNDGKILVVVLHTVHTKRYFKKKFRRTDGEK